MSSLIEKKVRGWLTGVIDDMRRSSPVQQWLDSLPVEDDDKSKEELEPSTSSVDEVQSPLQLLVHDETKLEVPDPKELWKRKSLESGVLTSTPRSDSFKKTLQRDYSIQSENYSPRLKNPLFRDSSLQVICVFYLTHCLPIMSYNFLSYFYSEENHYIVN